MLTEDSGQKLPVESDQRKQEVGRKDSIVMARAYSGILAAVAVSLAITRGLVLGSMPNEILVQSLWFFFLFAGIGFGIGFVAERVVTESLESQYRSEVAALHAKANSTQPEQSE